MTATFTVEDGSGLASANSYSLEAFANQYHEDHSGSASWAAAVQAVREKHLRLATQFVDVFYGERWKGSRRTLTQALDWPRVDVYDRDGYYVDSGSVPLAVQQAVCEMALRSLDGEDILKDLPAGSGTLSSKSVSAGPVSVSKTWIGGSSPTTTYRVVDNLLAELLEGTGVLERG